MILSKPFPFYVFFLLSFLLSCKVVKPDHSLALVKAKQGLMNLDFRQTDSANHPTGWRIPQNDHFEIQLDTALRRKGYAAFSIRKKDSSSDTYQVFARFLPLPTRGDTLEFSAAIRTEQVTQGTAGLIAMVLDREKQKVSYKAMVMDGVSGTHDWQRYGLKLPIDVVHGDSIYIIGILTGSGKAWIGNLEAKIDGRPLSELNFKLAASDPNSAEGLGYAASAVLNRKLLPATDSLFSQKAGNCLSPDMTGRLTDLGMLWGFLKYYHPAVSAGLYDWDSALFRILPAVIEAPDKQHVFKVEERWIRQLGKIPACKECALTDSDGIKVPADYGYLFDKGRFPEDIRRQLLWIRENYKMRRGSYYVSYRSGTLEFIHEEKYGDTESPPSALRLLSLYRFWSTVQYYFPYRDLITEDWNKMLGAYLSRFVGAQRKGEYIMSCLELIGHIHDTHANVWGFRADLDSIKGRYRAPFEAVFAEGKLVVTKYLVDSPDIRGALPVGAIIHRINNEPVSELVQKFLPYTPASNTAAQYRDLPAAFGFLLRSNREISDYEYEYHDSIKVIALAGVGIYSNKHLIKSRPLSGDKGFAFIGDDIGYIRPDHLSAKDFSKVRQSLGKAKGIIIDMRCYPASFMGYTYGSWFKGQKGPFAFAISGDIRRPGCMSASPANENGGNLGIAGSDSVAPGEEYKGQVLILVNAETQSQAEYTTMALRSAPNVQVIGSTTAGADGDIAYIWLPGNVLTQFSSIGIYYPDGTGTQRVGVRIDQPLQVTIKGIREGKDEFLEEAIRMIRQQ